MTLDPTVYKTRNPVPSDKAKDLSDNARLIDTIANDSSGQTVFDRLGKERETLTSQLQKLGVIFDDPIRDWSPSMLVEDLRAHRYPAGTGDVYIPVAPLPFTTNGTFNTANWALYNGLTVNNVVSQGFSDVSSMIAGINDSGGESNLEGLASINARVVTKVHNTKSNTGGCSYEVLTLADYGFLTPDGEQKPNGDWVGADYADASGQYVFKKLMTGADIYVEEFGYIGFGIIDNGPNVIATPDPDADEWQCIDKVFKYLERGAPLDVGASSAGVAEYIQKGKYNIVFPSRSICNISQPIPPYHNRTSIEFNGTEIRPQGPFVALYRYSYNSEVSRLVVNYTAFNTDEEIYEAHLAGTDANGISIMGVEDPLLPYPLESFTKYTQCVVVGGWDGFNGSKEGLMFGIDFDGCKAEEPLGWGFNFGGTGEIQLSTTCTMERPFIRLTKRDKVQHNGYVWFALRHMSANDPQEPPAVPVSNEYWQISLDNNGDLVLPTTEPAWTAKFYRAFGKHYSMLNMSNLSMINPSGDGGTDVEPTFVFSGIDVSIDNLHLEKHEKVFSDRPTFVSRSGSMTVGTLYLAECRITNEGNSVVQNAGGLYSCRVGHTSVADNEPGVGANWHDYWDLLADTPTSQDSWALSTDYTTGDATFFRAEGAAGRGLSVDNIEQKLTRFKSGRIKAVDGEGTLEGRVYTGKGISENLTKNMRGHISQRGFVKPPTNVVSLISPVTVFTYRPRPEQNGTLFKASLVPDGVVTIEVDGDAPLGS